jgi:hypothetical protein
LEISGQHQPAEDEDLEQQRHALGPPLEVALLSASVVSPGLRRRSPQDILNSS